MCQRVYIASPVELRTVRRSSTDPSLEVAAVSDVPTIRAFLRADLPFLHLAGGHVGCGCGFPSETADSQPDPKKLDQADLASLAALAECVRRACRTYAGSRSTCAGPPKNPKHPKAGGAYRWTTCANQDSDSSTGRS